MPDDPDDQKESELPAETAARHPVAVPPPGDAVPTDPTETTIAPTAAELLLNIRGSAAALTQIGLAGARAPWPVWYRAIAARRCSIP
jgi:hypothetical protein